MGQKHSDRRGAAWQIGLGVAGAVVGVMLSYYLAPPDQPLSPESRQRLAWSISIGLTLFFAFIAAMFGYAFAIKPAGGPRERAAAVQVTLGATLLTAVLPWIIYWLAHSGRAAQSLGWGVVAMWLFMQLLSGWREIQARTREEESAFPADGRSIG